MGATCAKNTKSPGRSTELAARQGEHPVPGEEFAAISSSPPEALRHDGVHVQAMAQAQAQAAASAYPTVGTTLAGVMESSYAVMGERPPQVENLKQMIDLAAEHNLRVRDLQPSFWQDEMQREGAQVPDMMEMATLAEWVFHAELAYEADANVVKSCVAQCGMVLMQHNVPGGNVCPTSPASPHSPLGTQARSPQARSPQAAGPGGRQVGYYIAFDPSRRLAVLSVVGAPLSVANISEHLVAPSEPLGELRPGSPPSSPAGVQAFAGWPASPAKQAWAHSTLAAAARAVVDDTSELVEHMLVPQGYIVVLTGHGLGGGVASCAAKLLIDRGVPVQCCTFGTPPCLDRLSALSCVNYMVSVVNGDDAIPRASSRNLKMMGSIFQASRDAHILSGGAYTFDHRAIHAQGAAAAITQPERDLFVPGKVVFLYSRCGGGHQAAMKDGTLGTLRRVELTPKCLADHDISEYLKATVKIASRLCGRPPSEFPPWRHGLALSVPQAALQVAPQQGPASPVPQAVQQTALLTAQMRAIMPQVAQATRQGILKTARSAVVPAGPALQAALPAAKPASPVAQVLQAALPIRKPASPVAQAASQPASPVASRPGHQVPLAQAAPQPVLVPTQSRPAQAVLLAAPQAVQVPQALSPQSPTQPAVLQVLSPQSPLQPAVVQASAVQVQQVVQQASEQQAPPLQVQQVPPSQTAPQPTAVLQKAMQLPPVHPAPQSAPQSPTQTQTAPQPASHAPMPAADPLQADLLAIQGLWFHRGKLGNRGVVVTGSDIKWSDGHKTPVVPHGGGVFTTTWKGSTFRATMEEGELRWNDGDVWVRGEPASNHAAPSERPAGLSTPTPERIAMPAAKESPATVSLEGVVAQPAPNGVNYNLVAPGPLGPQFVEGPILWP